LTQVYHHHLPAFAVRLHLRSVCTFYHRYAHYYLHVTGTVRYRLIPAFTTVYRDTITYLLRTTFVTTPAGYLSAISCIPGELPPVHCCISAIDLRNTYQLFVRSGPFVVLLWTTVRRSLCWAVLLDGLSCDSATGVPFHLYFRALFIVVRYRPCVLRSTIHSVLPSDRCTLT